MKIMLLDNLIMRTLKKIMKILKKIMLLDKVREFLSAP
jgi:hypothetical protein